MQIQLLLRLVFLILILTVSAVPGWSSTAESIRRLEQMLENNILPFWYPSTIDSESGGYRFNHDGTGRWLGPGPKGIVTQSRMVWFLSSLVRSGYGNQEHLAAARHGFRFLADKMWDSEFGGFYWSVDHTGNQPQVAEKHLYGQSFALYGISEYYLASGDREALELAQKLFALLEFRAHDRVSGGYREFFMRDWTHPPEEMNGPMGVTRDLKLMNTHLHLMEAFTTYYEASSEQLARERLIELINIESNTVVRKDYGACTDRYQLDWTPMIDPAYFVVSYGHDLENIWLLGEALRTAGLSEGPFYDLFSTLFDYSLRFGFDQTAGGFFHRGPVGEQAVDRAKVWWVQAEALVSALMMYSIKGSPVYWNTFEKTLEWILTKQIDMTGGDWHAEITVDGHQQGGKAGLWKSPYHNGRAVLKCLQILKTLN